MDTIGSFDAKTHLPQLLDRVAKGERFTITKHGVPVARLVPAADISEPASLDQLKVVLEGIRSRAKAGPETLKDLINEGRRY